MTQVMTNQQNDTTTTWPEGVTARYANLAGATINIHRDGTRVQRMPRRGTDVPPPDPRRGHTGYEPHRALTSAQTWAQGHAEGCRALPRPA
ncbi:hypothetical protein [Streptomyces sp. V1I1]|uniref:hypothetical protein n=1 Tax=Streptomyces sp. V1I1 TaxID=3042272 RepID=UPI00277F68B4|nr:hypothetical protein [Streptomyces sp. V1I1]MDQ0945993.1 hypothetical protein [Streptomyces sp. V1I1]